MAKDKDGLAFDPWRLFRYGVLVLLAVMAAATLVYYGLGRHYGRDWSLIQCLFMVVITLTTIGYGDVLDIGGLPVVMIFTMVMAVVGIGVPAFVISNVTALIVEGVMTDVLRRKRMRREIEGLSGHTIICGIGATGVHCLAELVATKRPVVVVDMDAKRMADLQGTIGRFPYVSGDATNDDVLKEAGIERAAGLIACLENDRDNLFLTLTARSLNPRLRIISRLVDEKDRQKLIKAGADSVVSPNMIGGLRLVSEMVRPATVTFLDTMLRATKDVYRFEEVTIPDSSRLANKTLAELKLRERGDMLVVAVRKKGAGDFLLNPTADTPLEAGTTLVLLGRVSDIASLGDYAKGL